VPVDLQGSSEDRRFAISERGGDRYADCMLPGGGLTGTPEAALDCACGLYLNDPTAYFELPKDYATLHKLTFRSPSSEQQPRK
jgi:hypothetical protein